jgi:hypothetical protein
LISLKLCENYFLHFDAEKAALAFHYASIFAPLSANARIHGNQNPKQRSNGLLRIILSPNSVKIASK